MQDGAKSTSQFDVEVAYNNFKLVLNFLALDEFDNYHIQAQFGNYFQSSDPIIQERLSALDLEHFKTQFRRNSELGREELIKYLKSEFNNPLFSWKDKFELLDFFVQSPNDFSTLMQIRRFIFSETNKPTIEFNSAQEVHQYRTEIYKRLLAETKWDPQASNVDRLKSLRKQQTLITNFRYDVIAYREKMRENFCKESLYRRAEGTYPLNYFADYLEHNRFIPFDHIDAFFKFIQVNIFLDLGPEVELDSEVEREFAIYYRLLTIEDKLRIYDTDIEKFGQYCVNLESNELGDLKKLLKGKENGEKLIEILSLFKTMSTFAKKDDIPFAQEAVYPTYVPLANTLRTSHDADLPPSVGIDADRKDQGNDNNYPRFK